MFNFVVIHLQIGGMKYLFRTSQTHTIHNFRCFEHFLFDIRQTNGKVNRKLDNLSFYHINEKKTDYFDWIQDS